MPAKLERTMFATSRAGEYFDARQLSALVGVGQDAFAAVCLKELVDNALDACEAGGVAPNLAIKVRFKGMFLILTVLDNGPGLAPEVVREVLDYNNRVSDKAAYRSPTRGAQGNALKTVVGIPYALGARDESVTITSRGVSHRIAPEVDPAGNVRVGHREKPSNGGAGTNVSLAIP